MALVFNWADQKAVTGVSQTIVVKTGNSAAEPTTETTTANSRSEVTTSSSSSSMAAEVTQPPSPDPQPSPALNSVTSSLTDVPMVQQNEDRPAKLTSLASQSTSRSRMSKSTLASDITTASSSKAAMSSHIVQQPFSSGKPKALPAAFASSGLVLSAFAMSLLLVRMGRRNRRRVTVEISWPPSYVSSALTHAGRSRSMSALEEGQRVYV